MQTSRIRWTEVQKISWYIPCLGLKGLSSSQCRSGNFLSRLRVSFHPRRHATRSCTFVFQSSMEPISAYMVPTSLPTDPKSFYLIYHLFESFTAADHLLKPTKINMSNSASAQAATLQRFLDAWKKWDAAGMLATFSDDFTQVTLPLALGIPPRPRAEVEAVFPALVATVKSYEVGYLHSISIARYRD